MNTDTRPAPPPIGGKGFPSPHMSPPPVGRKRIIQLRPVQRVGERIMLYATDGWGKTTIGAYAPNPLLLMSPGETGYDTLRRVGQAPEIPAEEVTSWPDLLAWVDTLIEDPQGRQSLVIDAITGMDRLLAEYVCNRSYNGNWQAFDSFEKGWTSCATELVILLQRLDVLRTKHGMHIVILCHAEAKKFKDPLNPDYDKYVGGVNQKNIWPELRRWADCVLFGTFVSVVSKEKTDSKAKGHGGDDRILYTSRRDAFDAKNRYGLPEALSLTNVAPSAMWSALWSEIESRIAR